MTDQSWSFRTLLTHEEFDVYGGGVIKTKGEIEIEKIVGRRNLVKT